MGQRNMLYTGPMLETEHSHLHPEPCVLPYGGMPSFPQPTNNHTILPPPGNRTSFNPQHLPENHGPLPHGITQYNGVDHHRPANGIEYNNIFMTPSGARVFPVAINHGIQDQLPFSGIRGSLERNDAQFMDGLNGAFKRKNAEGFPGNIHYFYPAPGSSSSVAIPMNADGIPDYRGGNDVPLVMEAAVHRSARNRGTGAIGVDPGLAHSNSHLIPGNYGGQPLQAVPAPWLDQQFCGNGSDACAFSWNHAPGIPYLQGIPSNRNSAASAGFVRPPPPITPHQGPHNLHHPPPPPMPPMQGHNMDFHSQLASTSRRVPTNSTTSYPSVNPFQNGIEPGPRYVGPTPPTGLRVYRPHRREMMVEATARHHGFPHLRVLPEDGVAILDISGYHEVGHSVDHHRDMRLDIDHMSYEAKHLKTRVYAASSKSSSDPEDALPADQELNSCVICQTNYDDEEQIGVLDCGHEYHVECVKKWLIVKNTCPVCKSTALAAAQTKES
ncbi:Zinc finger, RING/FYVE/PHD-type [Cynara cardunculus var. scolymus]|uniref:RING-type E3 ubiquitin transferase n=1 Tax=Cynara cardunculus var. scolymus TaxID=59895 RepID=A0A103XLW3_CYNCS|nr:Zinc finger, RING/FYVE/PHD-type [Cynara cardunculus var. scolymus]